MDSENRNKACYAHELEFCVRLITALECLVELMEDSPVRYPKLIADVVCLIKGRLIRLSNGQKAFCNGLEIQIQELYETMEALELEVQYEMGDDDVSLSDDCSEG